MTIVGVAARLLVQAGSVLVLAPVLLLARRFGWAFAGRIPVAFHRLFVFLFGIKVRVRGHPPEPDVPTLVLANHVSWLDIPIIGASVPLSFVAKSEIAGWPVVGLFAKLQGCIFLDRARKGATAEVNAAVADRLARGDVIVLFPEGTTGDGNRLLPFKSSLVGAARAALTGRAASTGGRAEGAVDVVATIRLQPLAIAYTGRDGLPVTRRERAQIAWYGDMELAPHFAGFLKAGPLDATLVWGEAILLDAASDRKRATAQAEAGVRRAIRSLAAP